MKFGQGIKVPGMDGAAYGWASAVKLAKEDPAWLNKHSDTSDKARQPYRNADSIALFASGE